MIQLAEQQLLAETLQTNEYVLIADLPNHIKVGVNQLKSRLEKKVGYYPGALATPHIKLCALSANSSHHARIINQFKAATRDFAGMEIVNIERIQFKHAPYQIDLKLGSSTRIERIKQEIKTRLKIQSGIQKHIQFSKTMSINIGHGLSQEQYIQASIAFKSLQVVAKFEISSLRLLRKSSNGNYRVVETFKL